MTCPQCKGAGSWPPPTRQLCDVCKGKGSTLPLAEPRIDAAPSGRAPRFG
jgi:DnaJ-class molecular chaperone